MVSVPEQVWPSTEAPTAIQVGRQAGRRETEKKKPRVSRVQAELKSGLFMEDKRKGDPHGRWAGRA